MKFIRNKKLILLLIFLGVFTFSSAVLALEINWPNSPAGTPLTEDSTLTDLVKYLYEWGIALGGLAAFIALIIAGFLYLTSVGDPGKMQEAKDRIKSAFLGLVFLLSSWLFLHTINPELTTLQEIQFDPGAVPEVDVAVEEPIVLIEPCKEAMIFPQTNFEGTPIIMEAGDRVGFDESPMSFKFCKEIREGETKKEGDKCGDGLITGGACTLQLFDGGFLGIGCGGPVIELIGPEEKNLDDVMGIEVIKCLELVARGQ